MAFKDIIAQSEADISALQGYFIDLKTDRKPLEYLHEYNNNRVRRLTSVGFRETKTVGGGEGEESKTVFPAQVIFGFPKKIVTTAAAFICGGEMQVQSSLNPGVTGKLDEDAATLFQDIWENKLKMQNVIKDFVRTVMIETKSAIVFFPQKSTDEKTVKLRAKVLKSNIYNEESQPFFMPHFDEYGDMDAFMWIYQGTDPTTLQPATITTLWTDEWQYTAIKGEGGARQEKKPNLFKKIPVVYGERDHPEWEDIVILMDRFEQRISRLSDCNDYFAEPLLKLYGNPVSMPGKDMIGKVVKFETITTLDGKETKSDAQYLTWDQTPESIKLETENYYNGIFSMSMTPDTSWSSLKGVTNITGIAMKFMFMDASIKADLNNETFEPAIRRMISVVKSGLGNIVDTTKGTIFENMQITVKFDDPLPDDLKEKIDVLMRAGGDKPINSQKTLVAISPFTQDAQAEMDQITEEASADNVMNQNAQIGSFFSAPKDQTPADIPPVDKPKPGAAPPDKLPQPAKN